MKKITPLGENVLIKVSETKNVTENGIIIPNQNNEEKQREGKIISTGKDKKINPEIKEGAWVIFEKYEGSEIELNKEKFIIIKSKNILAILE